MEWDSGLEETDKWEKLMFIKEAKLGFLHYKFNRLASHLLKADEVNSFQMLQTGSQACQAQQFSGSLVSMQRRHGLRFQNQMDILKLVTLKVVDPNDTKFLSYEMTEGLDKEHVLVIVYERHLSLQDWIQQHQVVIGGRLNQELISILWDLFKAIQYLVPLRKLEGRFDMHNVVVVNGRRKITGLCDDYEGQNLLVIRLEIASVLENIFSQCYGLEINQIEDFRSLIVVLRQSNATDDHVFRIIHKHPLLLTPPSRVAFRLLSHTSLLRYNSNNQISQCTKDYQKFLYACSLSRPCINTSWTQWVKYNNRPNYSQELKRALAWPSTPYSDSLDLDKELNLLWPGFLGMIFEMLLEFQSMLMRNSELFDQYIANQCNDFSRWWTILMMRNFVLEACIAMTEILWNAGLMQGYSNDTGELWYGLPQKHSGIQTETWLLLEEISPCKGSRPYGTQASLEIPRRNLAYGVKADVITWRGIRITVLDALKLLHPRCQSLLKRTAQLYP
ncbi:hypothetical protein AAG906_001293 [Vitis piasezkii]